MPMQQAIDFLNQELQSGTQLPKEYKVASTRPGRHFKIIIIPPSDAEVLEEIRKEAGVDSLNFAPTGSCPCCLR